MTKMLKVKHAAIQVLPMRTRAVATLMIDTVTEAKYGILLAKGSISPPESIQDSNDYIVQLYVNREPGQKTMTRPFVSIRDQMMHGRDVVRATRPFGENERCVIVRNIGRKAGIHLHGAVAHIVELVLHHVHNHLIQRGRKRVRRSRKHIKERFLVERRRVQVGSIDLLVHFDEDRCDVFLHRGM